MKRINSLVWGTVLLLVGVVLTLGQLNVLNITTDLIWPIILLSLALLFHLYFFLSSSRNEGLLVPGGILLVYGFYFLAVSGFDAEPSKLWPLFILGPAFGLLELYVFSKGRSGSLIPVFILAAIGGGFLITFNTDLRVEVIFAIILIGIGLSLMVSAIFRGPRKNGYRPIEVKAEPRVEPVTDVKAEPTVEQAPKQ